MSNQASQGAKGSPVNAIVSGVINGAMAIPLCIALASVIFSGDLRPYFPLGIGLFLVGNAMVSAIASLHSSSRYGMAGVQDSTPAIVALMVVSIAASTHNNASTLPTVVAAIAISTLVMGLTLYGLGQFRLGVGARFFPPSVVSGFLAGTGVILLLAGLGFLMNTNLTMVNLDQLFLPGAPGRWLPGTLFGIALVWIHLRFPKAWVLPTLLFASALIFALSLHVFQISTQTAIARGWIEGGFPTGRLWPPLSLAQLDQIDWAILGRHVIHYLIIAFVGSLALLLNASGLEQTTEEEIDLDRELRGNGLANLVAGLFGGANGYLSISGSALSHELKAPGRLPSLINAGMSAAALGFGMSLLQVFPNFLLGGLTIFLGLCMLKEPCLDNFKRFSRVEYGSTILVMVVIAYFGFINGVLIGLLASFVFFVISSSRVDLVKFTGTCRTIQSERIRTRNAAFLLRSRGGDVRIFALQGSVFFGSSFKLYQRMQVLFDAEERQSPRFLLLDFRDVVGIDSGGMTWISRLAKLAGDRRATLVLSELSPLARRQFLRFIGAANASGPDLAPSIHLASDMDEALQWCEDKLLAATENQSEGKDQQAGRDAQSLESLDAEALQWSSQFVAKAGPYLQRRNYQTGSVIWRHGEESMQLYLLESGEVEVSTLVGNGHHKRHFCIGPGTVLGEISFFLKSPRIGTATCIRDAVLHVLTRDQLDAMAREQPELALDLQNRVLSLESMLVAEDFHAVDFVMG
ncbi:MAG: SulP family inorganic anion transporter [Synechococcaceae cyanobacterium ELA263]